MRAKFIYLFTFFTLLIYFLPQVLAISGCCVNPDSTGICISVETASECNGDFKPGQNCEVTQDCNKGCCIDEAQGTCSTGSTKSTCILDGGKWDSDKNCNLAECIQGCCDLGEMKVYSTKARCGILSESFQIGKNQQLPWDSNINYFDCRVDNSLKEVGACTTLNDDGTTNCKISSELECSVDTYSKGKFYLGKLCTSEALGTVCKKTELTTCLEGKDQVYFLDSCGNPANIYDSSKVNDQTYWENIISPEMSCNSNSGNENSKSCGNCNFNLGGICSASKDFKPDYGNNYCQQTSCEFNGEVFKPGESWCVYEGKVGDGDDIPGSTHRRFRCDSGKIIKEVTGTTGYRDKVCQQKIYIDDFENKFRSAENVLNPSKDSKSICLTYNEEEPEEMVKSCMANSLCFLKKVDVDTNFKFSYCVSKYPVGFDLITDNNEKIEAQEEVCNIGTKTCIGVEQRKWHGTHPKWKWVSNKRCTTKEFTKQMNDFCRSLGDCGATVNIAGEFTDEGYSVSGAPRLFKEDINKYKKLKFNELVISENSLKIFSEQRMDVFSDKINDKRITTNNLYDKWNSESGFKEVWLDLVIPYHAFLTKILGWGKTKKHYITFTCKPWTPPVGGKDCELCNKDFDTCTEYRCESLGTACELINRHEKEKMCVAIPDDGIGPKITFNESSEGLRYIDEGDLNLSLKTEENTCLNPYPTVYNLSFETDEPAQCKYSYNRTLISNYPTLDNFGTGAYIYNHKEKIFFLDPNGLNSEGINITHKQELFILCRDKNGNFMPKHYEINTCTKEAKDIQGPRVIFESPKNGSYVSSEATESNLTILTDELAECRWSKTPEIEYYDMENNFTCPESITELGFYKGLYRGYKCNATIPLEELKNSVYIKCLDQPWLNKSKERNVFLEDYVITINKIENKIEIDNLSPLGDLETPTDNLEISVEAQTSKGGNKHTCSYTVSKDNPQLIKMWQTGNRGLHVQPGINLPLGRYTLNVTCHDETGDKASKTSEFRIVKDDKAPKIIRMIDLGSSIKIITSEDAECSYSTRLCQFNWTEGKKISSGKEHIFSTIKGEKYYIKCKDEWENVPTFCSLILGS